MPASRTVMLKTAGLFLLVAALVCLPFAWFGEDFALPLLQSREQQAGALLLIAVVLLAADSVAPVPSTVVIMFLAAKAGPWMGILGGTVGLTLGVLTASWFGGVAVGRVVPRFVSDEELGRLRHNLQHRLTLTLACWRSVPVMAETSVILAAAAGVPMRRIFLATLLPNLLVATIYSLAADDSFITACVTFIATLAASAALWWFLGRRVAVAGSR